MRRNHWMVFSICLLLIGCKGTPGSQGALSQEDEAAPSLLDTKLVSVRIPKRNYSGQTYKSATYADVMTYSKWRHLGTNEPAVNAHETMHHFYHQYPQAGGAKLIYDRKGVAYPLLLSLAKADIVPFVPQNIRKVTSANSSSKSPVGELNTTFLNNLQRPNDRAAIHLIHKWNNYIHDEQVSVELPARLRSSTSENMAMHYFAASGLLALKKKKATAFEVRSGERSSNSLPELFPLMAKRSMASVRASIKAKLSGHKVSVYIYKELLEGSQSEDLRTFLKKTYGEKWFNEVYQPDYFKGVENE